MAFCPPMDGNHASRLPLVGDLAHPLLTSLSFLSKSIEGSPGKISCHQMACHFLSLPMCWLLRCDVSDRCFSPYLDGLTRAWTRYPSEFILWYTDVVSRQLHLLHSSFRKELIIHERSTKLATKLFLSSVAQWHRDGGSVYAQSQFNYPWLSA